MSRNSSSEGAVARSCAIVVQVDRTSKDGAKLYDPAQSPDNSQEFTDKRRVSSLTDTEGSVW